jgi:hypothetical protein
MHLETIPATQLNDLVSVTSDELNFQSRFKSGSLWSYNMLQRQLVKLTNGKLTNGLTAVFVMVAPMMSQNFVG